MFIRIFHVSFSKEIKSAKGLPRMERRLELEVREKDGYLSCFRVPVSSAHPPAILTLFPASVILLLPDLAGISSCSSRSLLYPEGVLDSVQLCLVPTVVREEVERDWVELQGVWRPKSSCQWRRDGSCWPEGVTDGMSAWSGQEEVGSRTQVSQHKVGWVFKTVFINQMK